MKPKQSSSLTAIILALFVVLPTVVSVWIDGRIKNYQDRLLVLEISRSNYLQLAAYHDERISFFELSGMLGGLGPKLGEELFILGDSVSKGDTEQQELLKRYESGHLTAAQYIKEMGNVARRKKQYYVSRFEQTGNEITRLHSNPPFVFGIKKFLPIVQVMGVISVVLINVLNLRQTDA